MMKVYLLEVYVFFSRIILVYLCFGLTPDYVRYGGTHQYAKLRKDDFQAGDECQIFDGNTDHGIDIIFISYNFLLMRRLSFKYI